MRVIKVEIWPMGSEEERFEIGRLTAANISAGAPVSSYEIRLSDRHGLAGGRQPVALQIDGHQRRAGCRPLIHKALAKAIEEGLVPVSGD